MAVRSKLARVVARTPEVMVRVTGRTRDARHLAAHLSYITRKGELPAEGRDGLDIRGAREVSEVAEDWSITAELDSRRRVSTPFSVSIILSMPADTDAVRLRDAARAFAAGQFGDRHDYLFALHTDTRHPHVHLTVRALGDHAERLNPKKADLEAWRQMFAEALRERGIAAEATPRRARGVTRKAERMPVRKVMDLYAAGRGPAPAVLKSALAEAVRLASGSDAGTTEWERAIAVRQARIRATWLAQARLLQAAPDPLDRQLGAQVEQFVRDMPAPVSRRLSLARQFRARETGHDRGAGREGRPEGPARGRDR
jgi:type IV secretory pathway VirD2 relaxase